MSALNTSLPPVPTTSHHTPLLDASVLVPGVRVLVKDETRYASGSHKEPAARAVVADAKADGFSHIVLASCGNYGRAMAIACAESGLTCTVVLPAGWSDGGAWMRAAGANVELIDGSYEEAVDQSRRLAAADPTGRRVDGNVDGAYEHAVFRGHGVVVDALAEALSEPPSAMWIPAGNGTTIIAIERRLRALGWGTILNGVGSQGNNPLLTSSVGAYRTLDPLQVHTTDHNQPLVNWHALQGPQALEAVARTDGSFHGVSDDDLCAAAVALSGIGARPTAAGAVAFAGLLNEARHGGLVKGTHIVLLSGRDITTPTQQSEARPFTETPESGHS